MDTFLLGLAKLECDGSIHPTSLTKMSIGINKSVFILSISEYKEWVELYELIRGLKTKEEQVAAVKDFSQAIQYIAYMGILCGLEELRILTPITLGDSYAVFFAKEEEIPDRSVKVKEAIIEFKKDHEKPNSS